MGCTYGKRCIKRCAWFDAAISFELLYLRSIGLIPISDDADDSAELCGSGFVSERFTWLSSVSRKLEPAESTDELDGAGDTDATDEVDDLLCDATFLSPFTK